MAGRQVRPPYSTWFRDHAQLRRTDSDPAETDVWGNLYWLTSSAFVADAVILQPARAGSFGVSATIVAKKLTVDARVRRPEHVYRSLSRPSPWITGPSSLIPDVDDTPQQALRALFFDKIVHGQETMDEQGLTVDAWLADKLFLVSAEIAAQGSQFGSFVADATVLGEVTGSSTVNAVLQVEEAGSFVVDAWFAWRIEGAFTAGAVIQRTMIIARQSEVVRPISDFAWSGAFSTSAGVGLGWSCIDEAVLNTGDWVFWDGYGARAVFTMTDPVGILPGSTDYTVHVYSYASNGAPAAGQQLGLVNPADGTIYSMVGADFGQGMGIRANEYTWTTRPWGGAWTWEDIAALQTGGIDSGGYPNNFRLYQLYATITWSYGQSITLDAVIKREQDGYTSGFDAFSFLPGDIISGSWVHTPSNTPRGVFVLIGHGNWNDRLLSVTYGGITMPRVVTAYKDSGSQHRSYIYFLGSGIPPGPQTVTVTSTVAEPGHSSAVSFSALEDMVILDSDGGTNQPANTIMRWWLDHGGTPGTAVIAGSSYQVNTGLEGETQLLAAGRYLGNEWYGYQTGPNPVGFWAGFQTSVLSDYAGTVASVGVSPGFRVDAWIAGWTWVDAEIVPRRFTVDARIAVFFAVDAEVVPLRFPSDATIIKTWPWAFGVSAIRLTERTGSRTINSIRRQTQVGSSTVEAWLAGRFPVDSFVAPYFWVDAIRRETFAASFQVEAIVPYGFWANAFIHPFFLVDAYKVLAFRVNAVLKATMGPATFVPLSWPGTSGTILGQTANILSGPWSTDGDELAVIRITLPPTDGGDVGIYHVEGNLPTSLGTSTGEFSLQVPNGTYYVYSSLGNAYRPNLEGVGGYKDWSYSSRRFWIDAFVYPTFRVDAAIVWHFEFVPGLTVDAWLKRTWLKTFTAGAFVQPWFRVDAEIFPMRFGVSAWIRTDFRVDAWIIRRITGSFTASAFKQPSFRVNAVKRRTQERTFVTSSWLSNPVYGYFTAQSLVGYYFTAGSSIRLTKYRRFTSDAVLRGTRTSSRTVDAFVQPWFTLDAWIFRREFFVSAVVIREQTGTLTLGAAFVWHWVVQTTADAFVQPYFRVGAVRHENIEKTVVVSAAIVIRVFGSFSLQAAITGFQTDAVILRPNMGGVFTFYAWKIESIPQKAFLVQAEKRDPGAYWDPETETWLHLHFRLDAALVTRPVSSMAVDASFAIAGLALFSFSANARIYAPEVRDGFWAEAFIDAQRTVVYEGEGRTEEVITTVTERFSLPGWSDVIGGGENRITSLFRVAPGTPVVMTVWDWGTTLSTGLISRSENLWGNSTGGHSAFGMVDNFTDAGTTTIEVWPAYTDEDHHVYSWNGSNAYDPVRTEEGMVSYQRLDTITRARPAPTIDAWLVGTIGLPWTVDAEIVGREKLRVFMVDADISMVGEQRGEFGVESHVLSITSLWWRMDATFVDPGFTIDALIYHPSMLVDAFISPYITLDAVIGKTITPVAPTTGRGPTLDAVIVRTTRLSSFTAGADISGGEPRGLFSLDATVVGQSGWRIYLAAQIASTPKSVTVDACIAQRIRLDAWIQPCFRVDAHIMDDSHFIIFPEDGGPPVNVHGNPAGPRSSLSLKIEAFIPDEIPIGNDAEIERLISLILEAEAELEAMYCAYVHYTPQGAQNVGYGPNDSGTGRTSTLPDAISQVGYPGAGDIDDCWVVATVWAANAAGYSYRPTVPVFRRYARNPDRPGATGGTLDHVMRGARGCYPGASIRRYRSTSWDGFISLLKAGWTASLAVRSSGLPSSYRYGFGGGHQVGVAYQNGAYFIMNPLQHNGSRPREISGADLRRAARGFVGGTICAAMFS